jgi:mono/diheme cytochrome c family protein
MKILLILCGLMLLLWACGAKESTSTNGAVDGAQVYKKYCLLCHGADGKLGLNGAKDLTISSLSKAERIVLIKNGKNAMTPFEGLLSESEIEAVAEYTMQLK